MTIFLLTALYYNFFYVLYSGDSTRRFVRAVTIIDAPFTMEDTKNIDVQSGECLIGIKCSKPVPTNNGVKYISTCCVGFAIDIFQMIVSDLNMDVYIYIVEDGKYGALHNGEWDGLVADLVNNKADVVIAGLTVTKQRSNFIDFSVPYLDEKLGILVKPQSVVIGFINWEFITPLAPGLQFFLWIFFVMAIITTYIFENNIFFASLFIRRYIGDTSKHYSVIEAMTYIGGVTLQRDTGGKNPTRNGSRVSAILFAFGMVIVVTTYTAVLAAQSVQNLEKDPFQGSKDERVGTFDR